MLPLTALPDTPEMNRKLFETNFYSDHFAIYQREAHNGTLTTVES